jgi:mRNA interferase MazF
MSRRYKTLYDREQEDLRREKYGTIHRGDIFYFDKSNITGVEQQGGRPGVVVSNNMCNDSSNFLLVCYLTTQPKTNLPTHVPVVCEQESICLCEQVHTLSKEKLQRFCCAATSEEMKEIDKALVLTLGIDLNNLVPEEYKEALEKVKELEADIYERNKIINEQSECINDLKNQIVSLQNSIVPVENTPEYIRACTERDVYIKLYNDLLNHK